MSFITDDLKQELESEKETRKEVEDTIGNYHIKAESQNNQIRDLTEKNKEISKANEISEQETIGLKEQLENKQDIEKQVDKYKFELIQLKNEIEDLRNDTSEGNEAAQKVMNQLNTKDKGIDKLKQQHSSEVQTKNNQIKQREN